MTYYQAKYLDANPEKIDPVMVASLGVEAFGFLKPNKLYNSVDKAFSLCKYVDQQPQRESAAEALKSTLSAASRVAGAAAPVMAACNAPQY